MRVKIKIIFLYQVTHLLNKQTTNINNDYTYKHVHVTGITMDTLS